MCVHVAEVFTFPFFRLLYSTYIHMFNIYRVFFFLINLFFCRIDLLVKHSLPIVLQIIYAKLRLAILLQFTHIINKIGSIYRNRCLQIKRVDIH